MIKKLHYIWLGSNLPYNNQKIVDEWKSLMPDFEIYFWHEDNTRKYDCLFLRQTLKKKAYAFASDYLRLKIVYEHGGFYLDTDMKLVKPLDQIDVGKFMIGEQEEGVPNWGIFYSEKNLSLLRECLDKYSTLYFDQFKPPVIPYFLRDVILNKNFIKIYPPNVFYPMPHGIDVKNYNNYISIDTIGIHLWDFSWKKFKKKRTKNAEIIYRLIVLLQDFFSFNYPLYYFRINFIRISRLKRN